MLFPEVRAQLLRLVIGRPKNQFYVRQLAQVTGLALHTVQDELRKLGGAGLVLSWSNGYHRFFRAHREHPLFPHLLAIVEESSRLPRITLSAVQRSTLRRRKPKQPPARHLRTERAMRWGLFSKQ